MFPHLEVLDYIILSCLGGALLIVIALIFGGKKAPDDFDTGKSKWWNDV